MNHDPKRTIDRLDAFLEACDPVELPTLTTSRIQSTLDEIGAEVISRPQPAPRAARRRAISRPLRTVLVAVAVLVATAAAATAGWSARTGIFQPTQEQIATASPEEAAKMQSLLDMGGPGELLNPAAPDFREVALRIASDIPYPEGYESWRDMLIPRGDPDTIEGEVAFFTSGALRGWVAASAFIAWVHAWRQADIAGDSEAATHAAQVISEAPGWKAVTDVDPRPDPAVIRDQGVPTHTLYGWMLPYRDAVLADDRTRVEHLLATNYGWSYTADPEWRAQLEAHPEWDALGQDEGVQKYNAQKYQEFLEAGRTAPQTDSSDAEPPLAAEPTTLATGRATSSPPATSPPTTETIASEHS